MGAPRKYHWDGWLDAAITTLVRGVHYNCSQSAMAGMVRNAASKRKLKVKVIDTGISIIVKKVVREDTHTDKAAVAC